MMTTKWPFFCNTLNLISIALGVKINQRSSWIDEWRFKQKGAKCQYSGSIILHIRPSEAITSLESARHRHLMGFLRSYD